MMYHAIAVGLVLLETAKTPASVSHADVVLVEFAGPSAYSEVAATAKDDAWN